MTFPRVQGRAELESPGLSWAKRGTRPRAPHDQRTQWAYIFGAICREVTETPGNRAWPQISRFSSADQTRRFFCFVTANQ